MIYVNLILSPYSLFCVGSYASYELSFPTTWRFCCLVCGLISQVLLESREKHDFAHWYPHQSTSTRTTFFFHVHVPFLLDDILILVCIFWHLEDQQRTFVDDMKINHDAATMRSINLELSEVLGGWFAFEFYVVKPMISHPQIHHKWVLYLPSPNGGLFIGFIAWLRFIFAHSCNVGLPVDR